MKRRLYECCVVEYCGIQRSGKTTLMVADLMNKLLNPRDPEGYDYVPSEVFCNFWLDITGVHVCDNEQMLWVLTKARKERWPHKVFMVDECSQPPLFYARNTRDKLQTDLVTSLWQMPKLGDVMQYSSNIGNSVDIQQRDATWLTVMPTFYYHGEEHGGTRKDDYIDFSVCHAYEIWEQELRYLNPAATQEYFDSWRPVN